MAAEHVREVNRARCITVVRRSAGGPSCLERSGARARRRHRQQLRADLHQPAEHRLPLLQLGAESDHAVEEGSRQPPARAVHEPHVHGEPAELRVARRPAPADEELGIPPGVVDARAESRLDLLPHGRLGVDEIPGDAQVGVHRLAGDEQPHDLAGALEDQVDAEVAHHPLDRLRSLTAASEAVRGLVAAAALDLERVVHDPPAGLGVPHLCHRGLEPDVGVAAVGEERGEIGHRFHREDLAGHASQLLGDGIVLPDRRAPLHPLRGPEPGKLKARLDPATADAGSVRRPVLRVMSASLSPLPSPQSTLSTGTFTLVKRMMPFSIALSPMKWSRWTTCTPGQSVSTMNAVMVFGPGARHDHQQLRDGAVGAPELLAVQDVVQPVLGERRGGLEARRVGADLILRQRKGGHGALREPGQVPLLLLGGAEQLERRRHADGLRGREQRGQVAVLAGDEGDRAGVAVLAEAETAVLGGDLDAERADIAERADDVAGDLPLAVDHVAVHPLLHEPLEPLHERSGALQVGRIRGRERMDQVEAERALEHLAHEARRLPFLLARGFGDLAGLLLGGEGAGLLGRGYEDVSHGHWSSVRGWPAVAGGRRCRGARGR